MGCVKVKLALKCGVVTCCLSVFMRERARERGMDSACLYVCLCVCENLDHVCLSVGGGSREPGPYITCLCVCRREGDRTWPGDMHVCLFVGRGARGPGLDISCLFVCLRPR